MVARVRVTHDGARGGMVMIRGRVKEAEKRQTREKR